MDGGRYTYTYTKLRIHTQQAVPGTYDIEATVHQRYSTSDNADASIQVGLTATFTCTTNAHDNMQDADTLEHEFSRRVCSNTGSGRCILYTHVIDGDSRAIEVCCIIDGSVAKDDDGSLPDSETLVYNALDALYRHIRERAADMQPRPAYPARSSSNRVCDVVEQCGKRTLDLSTQHNGGAYYFDCVSRVEQYIHHDTHNHYMTRSVTMCAILPVQLDAVTVQGNRVSLTTINTGAARRIRHAANTQDIAAVIRGEYADDVDINNPGADDYHDAVETAFDYFIDAVIAALE